MSSLCSKQEKWGWNSIPKATRDGKTLRIYNQKLLVLLNSTFYSVLEEEFTHKVANIKKKQVHWLKKLSEPIVVIFETILREI